MCLGRWGVEWEYVGGFFSRQTLLPSGGVQKGGGVSGLDVESKVDSRSSLLEIISFRCTVPNYTHTHTLTQIHTR